MLLAKNEGKLDRTVFFVYAFGMHLNKTGLYSKQNKLFKGRAYYLSLVCKLAVNKCCTVSLYFDIWIHLIFKHVDT